MLNKPGKMRQAIAEHKIEVFGPQASKWLAYYAYLACLAQELCGERTRGLMQTDPVSVGHRLACPQNEITNDSGSCTMIPMMEHADLDSTMFI